MAPVEYYYYTYGWRLNQNDLLKVKEIFNLEGIDYLENEWEENMPKEIHFSDVPEDENLTDEKYYFLGVVALVFINDLYQWDRQKEKTVMIPDKTMEYYKDYDWVLKKRLIMGDPILDGKLVFDRKPFDEAEPLLKEMFGNLSNEKTLAWISQNSPPEFWICKNDCWCCT